jgi:predicted nucleic acid-binding protein
MNWLVDTNVISELSRKAPDAKVSQWLLDHQEQLYLSVLTVGELEKGLAKIADPARRTRLQRWIREEVAEWFEGRLLPVDQTVAIRWGQLAGSLRDPLPAIDTLIAATALAHGLTVATRNTNDLVRTGVALFNPWS